MRFLTFAKTCLLLPGFLLHFAYLLAQTTHPTSPLDRYVEQASEFSSRARANVYFPNPQAIFHGVQMSFVNVGTGNLTFLRRDLLASGRIPIVFARVYDSRNTGTVDFGPGWRLSAAETVVLDGHKAHLFSECGDVIDFMRIDARTFELKEDHPSDYSALVMTAPDTLQASLRTGLTKEFTLIDNEFRLTKVTDRNGNELRLSYQNGLLVRMQNANHNIVLSRTKLGRIFLAQDDQGRQVGFKYDNESRLVEADDRGGNPWIYGYAEGGKLQNAIDPLGRSNFSVGYDELGRVHTLRLPSGSIQYHYDSAKHETVVFDRKRLTSHFFQNEDGITTKVVNALGEQTEITLDAERNVTGLIRDGVPIEGMQYDQQHRLVLRHSVSDSGSLDREYSYDPATGRLSGIRASSGVVESFGYDAKGNLATAALPDGLHTFSFVRGDLVGFANQATQLTFTADRDGQIASMSYGKDNTTFAYEAGGELKEAAFPTGLRAQYEYQASGLRSKTVYKDGRRVEYAYDPAGNLTSTKVFNRKGTQINGQSLEMNDSYQLVHWVLFDGTETSFKYDPNGNLTEIKKGKTVTLFEYDALDRLTAVVTPDRQRLTYVYKPGERSLIEQYEHASINVGDLRDTGLTFGGPFDTIASRPLNSSLGSVRFSERLGSFQLANADGSDIVLPNESVEGALAKLHLYQAGMTQAFLQNGFGAPFNTMFMPAEYLTINCCPLCYQDESGAWVCPPCDAGGSGPPDHLEVLSDITETINCPAPTVPCVQRSITYEVVDISENPVLQFFYFGEQFDSISSNSCNNGFLDTNHCSSNPTSGIGTLVDILTIGCNSVGGACGLTATHQRWSICGIPTLPIGSPGTLDIRNNVITVGGSLVFFTGTDIFP